MRTYLFPLSLAISLTLGLVAGSASAQSQPTTVLPVWNKQSGKVEALLELQPTGQASSGVRWNFGKNSLDTALGVASGDSLGLICDHNNTSSISGLASQCMLASVGNAPSETQRFSALGALSNRQGKIGVEAGNTNSFLPTWLIGSQAAMGTQRMQQNDLTIYGQKNIGREGFVSIGGTYARARLVPVADQANNNKAIDQWDTKTLSVGSGYGSFSANIVGRVVDVPSKDSKWEALGLGITWRTPWSGQLTVGAENIVTRGKNPFSNTNQNNEGTVPYVRYEQGL